MKIVLTGATGMVGEGVLLECLSHPSVERVLVLGRRASGRTHPKLTELLIPDFLRLHDYADRLRGYDACFYCAGISSRGMTEADYNHTTYIVPLHVAQTLLGLNPRMTLCHISGSMTDSSEKGRILWARIKGKAENALLRLGFAHVYHFRPGFMRPTPGQQNAGLAFRLAGRAYPLLRLLLPNQICTLQEVGQAMIHAVLHGYPLSILEVRDIRALAARG
jgi:uncharacterized protein YbjT (DUF2867 family)